MSFMKCLVRVCLHFLGKINNRMETSVSFFISYYPNYGSIKTPQPKTGNHTILGSIP
jgi:hypothetical protein